MLQKRANFRLRTCTANDTISKFEIASVKNADLLSSQSLAILHSKMAKIIQGFSKERLTIISRCTLDKCSDLIGLLQKEMRFSFMEPIHRGVNINLIAVFRLARPAFFRYNDREFT